MAAIGGILGHVVKSTTGGGSAAAIGCVRGWEAEVTEELKAALCSASRSGPIRVLGNDDWTGKYRGYGPIPAVLPGDFFRFGGVIIGDSGDGLGVEGDAVCSQAVIDINIESGEIISHEVSFESNGSLSPLDTVANVEDTSVPNPATGAGMKVELAEQTEGGALGSYAEIADVRTVKITLKRDNKPYVSSSTSRATKRVKGNFDAMVDLTVFASSADGWNALPYPGTLVALRAYTSATLYWFFKWLRVSKLGDLAVDIETADVVGGSIGFQMSGVANVSGTPTVGQVAKPGGSAIWP